MSTNTRNKIQDGLIFAIGVATLAAIWIGLVYGLLGYIDPDGQRWAATITLAIVWPVSILITRRLTVQESRAHERGIDKGIEKVSKAAHDAADIRTRMTTVIKQAQPAAMPTIAPAHQWDDLLPRPGGGALIVSRAADDTSPIDL